MRRTSSQHHVGIRSLLAHAPNAYVLSGNKGQNGVHSLHDSGSLLECNRIIKTKFEADKVAFERFLEWEKKRKEWWVLVERRGARGVRYFKRDFKFFRVYNRFDKPYVKRVIKKFEFAKFFAEDRSFVHFILTVDHKQSIQKSISLLKENWNRLRAVLKKRLGKNYPFIAVIEPHKDGYPHLHVLYFTNKFVFDHKKLSEWCKERGLGHVVWLRRYWANGFRKKPIFYLIKYLGKQFKKKDWSFKELLFYACMWDLGAKTYTFSRIFGILNRKSKIWKKVFLGSFSELKVILKSYVSLHIYCFEYPLLYFNWSQKEKFLWRLVGFS